jgi:tRNA1Val (adenine37-N6)-methyltransferase
MTKMSYSVEILSEESVDHLTESWKIIQLRRGHRFSTDDMVVAWRAARIAPQAQRLLDLGCGVGSVGLLTLHRLENKQAELTGIEAQEVSFNLVSKTIVLNGLEERVRLLHGDIREQGILGDDARFDLITGSPPYKPLGTGHVSPVPQRAGARMELRGSVFDYCESAKRWLAPEGRFCFVMAAGDARIEEAPIAADLQVIERLNVVFRYGDAPMVAVMVCAHAGAPGLPERRDAVFTVRGEDGEWTAEYLQFRAEMGMPYRGGKPKQ